MFVVYNNIVYIYNMKTIEEKRAYQREYYHRKKNGILPVPNLNKKDGKGHYKDQILTDDARALKRKYQRHYYQQNRMKILSYMKKYYVKQNENHPKRPYNNKPVNQKMIIYHFPQDQPKTIIFE